MCEGLEVLPTQKANSPVVQESLMRSPILSNSGKPFLWNGVALGCFCRDV